MLEAEGEHISSGIVSFTAQGCQKVQLFYFAFACLLQEGNSCSSMLAIVVSLIASRQQKIRRSSEASL